MNKKNISYLCFISVLTFHIQEVKALSDFSKENDERNKRECAEVLGKILPEIEALEVKSNELILQNAKFFIEKHNVNGFKPEEIVQALKSKHDALFLNADKLKSQTIKYKNGDVANKTVCETAAKKTKEELQNAYTELAKAFDDFSYNFLKCPKELTLEDTRGIYAMQVGKETTHTIRVKTTDGYINTTVAFKVDPDNMGDRFSNKLSAQYKVPKNKLDSVTTVDDKTYCTYEWDGYQKGWKSTIYYNNTVN